MITLYDKEFNVISHLNTNQYMSFVWIERLYDVGEFQLVVPSIIPNFANIYSNEFAETATVELESITSVGVTYIGRVEKTRLSNYVVAQRKNYTNKTADEIAKNLVSELTQFGVSAEPVISTGIPTLQVTGDNLLSFIQTLLQNQSIWCRIEFREDTREQVFSTYNLEDKTAFQALSSENNNISNDWEYEVDKSSYRNFAWVFGEGEGDSRLSVAVDSRKGDEEKREIYVDARDLTQGDLSLSEYQEVLRQRGLQKLADYPIRYEIDVTPQIDVKLGELRVFKNNAYGINSKMVVSEIITTYEDGELTKKIRLDLHEEV